MKKILLTIGSILSLCAPAMAGLQVSAYYNGQTNAIVTANTVSNSLGNASIGQTFFDFSKTTDATIAVTGSSVTVPATNTFTFSASVDTVNWISNALTLTLITPAGPSTNATVITNLVKGQIYPFYTLNMISNTGTTGISSNLLIKAFSKTGF